MSRACSVSQRLLQPHPKQPRPLRHLTLIEQPKQCVVLARSPLFSNIRMSVKRDGSTRGDVRIARKSQPDSTLWAHWHLTTYTVSNRVFVAYSLHDSTHRSVATGRTSRRRVQLAMRFPSGVRSMISGSVSRKSRRSNRLSAGDGSVDMSPN